MPTDLLTLTCIFEIVAAVLIAVISAIARRRSAVRQSIEAAAETTRGTRSTWAAILAAIAGANAGYVILIGSHVAVMSSSDPANASTLWVPAAVAAYVLCAIPAYLALGAVCGLLVDRFAKRNTLSTAAAVALSFMVAAGAGALLAVPIYFVGLMGAAL